LIDAYN